MHNLLRAIVYAAAIAATGCAVDPLDMPTPPDLRSLVLAYDNPTAAFDASVARKLAADLTDRLKSLDSFSGLDQLWSEVIDPTVGAASADASAPSAERRGPFGLRDQGYAEVRHRCRNADGEVDGGIELKLTFHNSQIDPVLWGSADQCVLVRRDRVLRIDGQVSADHQAQVLLFDGTFETDDHQLIDGTVDLHRVENGLETLVPIGDQFLVLQGGKEEFGVRAKNGNWRCTVASGACAKAQ